MLSFYSTVGGRRFIDGTVPRLVDELARLNKNLEALVELQRARSARVEKAAVPPVTDGDGPREG